jgi:hypothetical protein
VKKGLLLEGVVERGVEKWPTSRNIEKKRELRRNRQAGKKQKLMTLLIVDVAFQSIRLMIVGAQLITVDAWTPACAVDQFYKKAGSKKPQSVKIGAFIFSHSPRRVGDFLLLDNPFHFR